MNDWDRYYMKGTLRKPTNIDEMYPAPTQPVTESQPYSYIDDLSRQAGWVLGAAAIIVLGFWLVGAV